MTRGQKGSLIAGIAAASLVVILSVSSDTILVRYHVYRLGTGTVETVREYLERPGPSVERQALLRFVATPTGRSRLCELVVAELESSLRQPRGSRGAAFDFKVCELALCGLRFRTGKSTWNLWADLRGVGTRHRGSVAALPPASGAAGAFAEVFETMCRASPLDAEIEVASLPEHRVRVESFAAGVERYEAVLKRDGNSLDSTAFWYETLDDWPEMLEAGTLLPWVLLVRRARTAAP